MVTGNSSARYAAAMAECGGRCPIEAGVFGRLADRECRHGRQSRGVSGSVMIGSSVRHPRADSLRFIEYRDRTPRVVLLRAVPDRAPRGIA